MLVLASVASASIAPTVSVISDGTQAGEYHNLTMTIAVNPSSSDQDTPQHLTVSLPSGALTNLNLTTSQGGLTCLDSTYQQQITADPSDPQNLGYSDDLGCQLASGTATLDASSLAGGSPLPLTAPLQLILVQGPDSDSLGGVQMIALGLPIGSPAPIEMRAQSDPDGPGANLAFELPYNISLAPGTSLHLPVDDIQVQMSLLDPTQCSGSRLAISADSYNDTTVHDASAPLPVSGCDTLPFAPQLSANATQDTGAQTVSLRTDVEQPPANPSDPSTEMFQSAARSVKLALPSNVLTPNAGVASSLCPDADPNPSSPDCTAIGSATASTPILPDPLKGRVYLTGSSIASPQLTLVFGAPLGIVVSGPIDLATDTTTLTGLPDMPITDLQLSLSGGQDAAYRTDCSSTSGTIDGALAAQDGATHSVDAPLHIDPCSPPATPAPPTTARAPRTPKGALTGARFAGLRAGRPSLSFKVAAAKGAPKLRRLTIHALAFKRTHGRIRGAAVKGGSIATRQLAGGKLVLTLAAPRAAVTGRDRLTGAAREPRTRDQVGAPARADAAAIAAAGHQRA
jgi:hypothetical protein